MNIAFLAEYGKSMWSSISFLSFRFTMAVGPPGGLLHVCRGMRMVLVDLSGQTSFRKEKAHQFPEGVLET